MVVEVSIWCWLAHDSRAQILSFVKFETSWFRWRYHVLFGVEQSAHKGQSCGSKFITIVRMEVCGGVMEELRNLFIKCPVFAQVRRLYLQWLGITSALHTDSQNHFFYNFMDCHLVTRMLGRHGKLFGLQLFGCLKFLFLLVDPDCQEILKVVKLKSWSWLNAKLGGFTYPISSWFANPRNV